MSFRGFVLSAAVVVVAPSVATPAFQAATPALLADTPAFREAGMAGMPGKKAVIADTVGRVGTVRQAVVEAAAATAAAAAAAAAEEGSIALRQVSLRSTSLMGRIIPRVRRKRQSLAMDNRRLPRRKGGQALHGSSRVGLE